jgi:hypothetical protein
MRRPAVFLALTLLACRESTSADPAPGPVASEPAPQVPEPAGEVTAKPPAPTPAPTPVVVVAPDPTLVANPVEPTSPSPTAPLRVDTLAFVASTGGPFPSMSDEASPRLVLHVDVELDHAGREQLASKLLDAGGFSRLDADAAALVELTPPREVWLFGSSGPCAAKLGSAYGLAYEEGPRALELGYLLEPCTGDFAPIAQLDAQPPPAIWTSAATTDTHELSSTSDWAKWKHDKRAAFEAIGALAWAPNEDETRRPDLHVRVREAESIVELGFRWHWPAPDCMESELGKSVFGSWNNDRFTPLPQLDPDDEFLEGELVGVLALAGRPIAIVSAAKFQMYVAIGTGTGFAAWAQKLTGAYHDEVTATAGWSVLEHDCSP